MYAGNITGRGDNAAFAATDDDRPVGKIRIVTFFYRGVKGIAINMGKRQCVKLRMGNKPWTSALDTALPLRRLLGQTVPAKS